jgi:hypothetical protein
VRVKLFQKAHSVAKNRWFHKIKNQQKHLNTKQLPRGILNRIFTPKLRKALKNYSGLSGLLTFPRRSNTKKKMYKCKYFPLKIVNQR